MPVQCSILQPRLASAVGRPTPPFAAGMACWKSSIMDGWNAPPGRPTGRFTARFFAFEKDDRRAQTGRNGYI